MDAAKSKIALVTGGSRGLGRDEALALARKGFDIIITYHRNKESANRVISEIQTKGQKAIALQLDISKTDRFDEFVSRLKNELKNQFLAEGIDAIINNAGNAYYAPFGQITEAGFDEMSDTHLKGPLFLTQKLLPLLNDGGSIVNTSSGLARFSYPGYATYAAMKAAIEVMTKYQAKELGTRGIRVNTVAPGAIATDFGGGQVRDNQDLNNMIASQTPLGRVGLADDIGGVVAFLCSEDAKWINGERIEVSGGIHL